MFSYEGKVTVIRKYKGRVLGKSTFHNNGTPALFRELCRCLVKGADSPRCYPNFLDLAAASSEKLSRRSLLRGSKSRISDRVEKEGDADTYKAVKTFNISYYDLATVPAAANTDQSEDMLVFRLLSDESDPQEFAFVPLVDPVTDNHITSYVMAEGETHEIIWEMSFGNLSESQLEVDAGGASSQGPESAAGAAVRAIEQEVDE